MKNPDMRAMPDHYPQWEDQVEAWIKDRRDQYLSSDPSWTTLDLLLDEYRDAADMRWTLEEVVNGVNDKPVTRVKKPKKERRSDG